MEVALMLGLAHPVVFSPSRLLRSRAPLLLSAACFVLALAGCQPDEPGESQSFERVAEAASAETAITIVGVQRQVAFDDVAHYTVVMRVGSGPNAEIAIHRVVRERAPWLPRRLGSAVMLLHGDFSTFPSNFLPAAEGAAPASHGLAGYLATQDIDVWGFDRRWTRTPADATDFSGYETMGLAADLDDTGRALAFARAARAIGGSGAGRLTLGGFSHGAQIAYEYAGAESQKPAGLRHVEALVPIDIYDRLSPEDDALRQDACATRDDELAQIQAYGAAGENSFFGLIGNLAKTAPDDPSPIFDGKTNREAVLAFMGKTWAFYAPTDNYHLAGGVLSGKFITSFRYSPEERIDDWLAAAPPFQSVLESADLDSIWCGDAPRPVPDHLADIHVPLFYLGAKGGFGDHGLYTVAQVGSSDVTTLVVSAPDAPQEREDWGHGDLLYGDDAPQLAWQPLAAWVKSR
jgi:hypothetical protein